MQKYFLLITSLIAVGLSAMISTIPIGLYNQGQVSAMLPTLFTPATYTFGIWSIIYLSWIVLGVGALLGKVTVSPKNAYLLGASQILSSLWLIPAQYLYINISLIVMSGILYYLTLGLLLSQKEHALFRCTLELFFGWILIATIANIHITLVDYKIYFFPLFLTVISIIIGFLINFFIAIRHRVFIAPLVFIWAAFGIVLGQTDGVIISLAAATSFVMTGTLLFVFHETLLKLIPYNYLKK